MGEGRKLDRWLEKAFIKLLIHYMKKIAHILFPFALACNNFFAFNTKKESKTDGMKLPTSTGSLSGRANKLQL